MLIKIRRNDQVDQKQQESKLDILNRSGRLSIGQMDLRVLFGGFGGDCSDLLSKGRIAKYDFFWRKHKFVSAETKEGKEQRNCLMHERKRKEEEQIRTRKINLSN